MTEAACCYPDNPFCWDGWDMNFARCCTGAPEEDAAATEKERWELLGPYRLPLRTPSWGFGLSEDVSVDTLHRRTRRELIFDEPSWWDANVDPAEDLERYDHPAQPTPFRHN